MLRKKHWLIGSFIILAASFAGSAHAGLMDVSLHVTTEPAGAKVTFSSMDTKDIRTYVSPADFTYDAGICFKPTLIIELSGYVRQVIHLKSDPRHQDIHVVLEKAAPGTEMQESQTGVPEDLGQSIEQWIPNIGADTPAFDPAHQ